MNELSTKVKKLNFFQKYRLKSVRKNNNLTFKQYLKLPEYIKIDSKVIYNLINNNDLKFEEVQQIPAGIFPIEKSKIEKYSTTEQAELIEKGYIGRKNFSDEEYYNIVCSEIDKQKDCKVLLNKMGDSDKDKFIKYLSENGLDDNIIEIFESLHEILKTRVLEEKPEIFEKISEKEQIKFYTQISDNKQKVYFKYMLPELQLKYITGEKNSDMLKYASMEAKKLFVEQNKNNVRMLTKEEQYQLVKEEKDIFQYMEPDMQQQYKMDNIEKLNSQELREFVLYSGKFGAIGNLDDSSRNLLHRRNKS